MPDLTVRVTRATRWVEHLFAPVLLLCGLALCSLHAEAAEGPTPLIFDAAETVQISGFQEGWHEPSTERLRFDAAHRRLLVRFPDAAERIARRLRAGHRITRVELLLRFKKTELYPKGYAQRNSFGVWKMYREVRPSWHAVAWPLRRPWTADPELAPTFNAWIRGTAYWGEPGAESKKADRFDRRFGPTNVSIFQAGDLEDPNVGEDAVGPGAKFVYHAEEQPDPEQAVIENPEDAIPAAMDVTASLTDRAFGESPGQRLRRLADCGFLLSKWETYDFRYRHSWGYPWAVSTGGRAIVIHPPRLKVTFRPGEPRQVEVPEPADIAAVAAAREKDGEVAKPPLAMPGEEEIRRRLKKAGFHRREWMNDWQWQRIQELRRYAGRMLPQTPQQYRSWVHRLLQEQPRYWAGWDNAERLLAYYRYAPTLPDYVRQHYFHDYWTAWLRPETPTGELVHPWPGAAARHGQVNALTYYRKTGDWRGNSTFYRGYTRNMGTMNFNHTATMGALLGGAIIDSEYAIQDGRYGLEHYPLRTWTWFDGSTQESIDHYYLGLTLVAQKMYADFGPDHIDRMMGRSILAKSLEELASAYHPHLRHFLASSTRTRVPQYLLAKQGGICSILHTLSRKGTLHDLDADRIPHGIQRFGRSVSPGEVQQMSMVRPWAPEWFANIVDEKPLPYHMTCSYKMWGHHSRHPLWRRTYLGEHYGLASTDMTAVEVQILGQWRRRPQTVRRVQDLGTMDVWYGINGTNLVSPKNGHRPREGMQATLQHQNKAVVVTSPRTRFLEGKKQISELKSTIAFYNYEEPQPSWRIYLDGDPVDSLPAEAKTGRRITIHDGLTYIGIVPLPATDLGNAGVLLHRPEPRTGHRDITTQAALAIQSYNLRTDDPISGDALTDKLRREMDHAYGGWVIEFGDAAEFGSFDAFRQHLRETSISTDWNADENVMHVTYESGGERLEVGVNTLFTGGKHGGSTADLFTTRTVNGRWPYLAEDVDRDTTLTRQGRAEVLEKNGARLRTEKGIMAYLQTEPRSGTYVAFNPLPDLTPFSLDVPGGVQVRTDGRVGITRVMVRPSENRVRIDHALKDEQKTGKNVAKAFFLLGLEPRPVIDFNGRRLTGADIGEITVDGRTACYVPLVEEMPPQEDLKSRLDRILSGPSGR